MCGGPKAAAGAGRRSAVQRSEYRVAWWISPLIVVMRPFRLGAAAGEPQVDSDRDPARQMANISGQRLRRRYGITAPDLT